MDAVFGDVGPVCTRPRGHGGYHEAICPVTDCHVSSWHDLPSAEPPAAYDAPIKAPTMAIASELTPEEGAAIERAGYAPYVGWRCAADGTAWHEDEPDDLVLLRERAAVASASDPAAWKFGPLSGPVDVVAPPAKPSRVLPGQVWRCVGVEGELEVDRVYPGVIDGADVAAFVGGNIGSARVADMLGLKEWSFVRGPR